MIERDYQELVIASLKAGGAHVTNHEDAFTPGIPDLSAGLRGATHWIEIKISTTKRFRDALTFSTEITAEQELFLVERGQTGGNCWLVAYVKVRGWVVWPWWLVPVIRAKKLPASVILDRGVRTSYDDLPGVLIRWKPQEDL